MNGQRRADGTDPQGYLPGEYGRYRDCWYGRAPSGHLGNLRLHDVTEHANGTISVRPSIKVSGGPNEVHYHGHLERGVWRSC